MILVLEEVDLPDDIYNGGNYRPSEISISDFPVEQSKIQNARVVTFRYWEKADVVYKDLKNRNGARTTHVNNHPEI